MKRLFVAIKIIPSDLMISTINTIKNKLNNEEIKWVGINNLHITLKFIGETHDKNIVNIIDVLDKVKNNHNANEIRIKGCGIFGSSYAPRIIWFNIPENNRIKYLGNNIIEKLQAIGIEKDNQNYVPHLTIARIKNIRFKNEFQSTINLYKDVFIQDQIIDSFYLYESILLKDVPQYNIIQTFKLLK